MIVNIIENLMIIVIIVDMGVKWIVKDMKGGKEDMTKKVIETVNGWYMENHKQKVELDDIVGLVKTDEPTDSVQLQKEAQLSIYEKRIIELENENEQLKTENTMLKEHQNINCQNCQYFVSDPVSSDCLKREDIGYKGTCIDGMDLHMLAKNCPYY